MTAWRKSPPPDTYRVADLVRLLDCSDTQVRKLVRRNVIPGAFRVSPRMIRFRKPLVDAWLAERLAAGGASA
jgi:predicted DNA-binding transcriptional regulator AlpA